MIPIPNNWALGPKHRGTYNDSPCHRSFDCFFSTMALHNYFILRDNLIQTPHQEREREREVPREVAELNNLRINKKRKGDLADLWRRRWGRPHLILRWPPPRWMTRRTPTPPSGWTATSPSPSVSPFSPFGLSVHDLADKVLGIISVLRSVGKNARSRIIPLDVSTSERRLMWPHRDVVICVGQRDRTRSECVGIGFRWPEIRVLFHLTVQIWWNTGGCVTSWLRDPVENTTLKHDDVVESTFVIVWRKSLKKWVLFLKYLIAVISYQFLGQKI